ncbi:BsaA family SipW-dependent biofilm matrix protein [Clostridium gasigenes]|uniref:Alternate signal-mediated exported protein, CPF_0494 family n=1 Tax=Clostridium gasigenes TaxID=94869 RepID=A0A1H0UPJ5_9CLOT|nr:BsaA family SipW-dependent biofilm matrix protein [Clostridium gasigenes]SDP68147.1 alternate signal-mediated exported protein, CPF_0494 family [Clostridium gasigenes]
MNKKKTAAILITGALAISIIGGTFAGFTASDSVTNPFSTGITDDSNNPNSGVKVQEEFKLEDAKTITPGTEINKDVQSKNTSSYDEFIRVDFKIVWKDATGTEVTKVTVGGTEYTLDNKLVELKTKNISTDGTQGTWVLDSTDDKYYYIGKVATGSYTNTLLDSVKLSPLAGNEYKNLKFDVVVTAEAIQASNGAYKDWASDNIKIYLGAEEAKSTFAPTDVAEPNGSN